MGHKYTKIIGEEGPGTASLYLGSIDWVIEDQILEELSIRSVVSVLPSQPQYVGEVLEKHDIAEADYIVYPLEDNADEYISIFNQPDVLSICDFIRDKQLEGKTVLVHCDAGITRSAVVVVSYLMTYGTKLHDPQRLSLEQAKAIVQDLRERMDICLFHDELERLEKILWRECPRALHPPGEASPFSPVSPRSWSDVRSEGDPIVKLELLRSTWRAIQELKGGELEFGRCVYRNIFSSGESQIRKFFAHVDMDRQALMMPKMLRQIVWCLDAKNLDKLVRFHKRLRITNEDFEAFHMGVMMALKENLDAPAEALEDWDTFLRIVFNRWARAIGQPNMQKRDLNAEREASKKPTPTASPVVPTGHAAEFPEPVKSPATPKECPFQIPVIGECPFANAPWKKSKLVVQPPVREETVVPSVSPARPYVAQNICGFSARKQSKGKPLPALTLPPNRFN